ncbi:MAG: hypothetical protein SPE88_05530 [Paludibacteraceae bacterium]|nr:hypothetical protein [Paludibacteraceae bacterium]
MKKIYSFMLALFATLCVGVAYAQDPISFTLNVSDAKAVKVQTMNGWDWTDLTIVDGKNQITATYDEEYGEYNAIQVVANGGYLVDSITFSSETAQQWEDQRNWGSDYGFALSPTSACNGAVYTVHTTNLNVLRHDTVVVIIDNPSKVKVMYYGSGQIDITDDTTIVAYCSDPDEKRLKDLPLTVRANYGQLIYKVFLNSDEVTKVSEYGEDYYSFNTLAKNDTIRVLTEAPADLVVPAILNLDEVAKEALDSVMVNGAKVALKDTLLVPWGKKIELAFNVADYEVTVNKTLLSKYSNPYTAVVTDTTKIVATAKAYEKYDVTLILHDYTCFEYIYVDNYIYPKQDTTVISMISKNPRVNLYAAKDCVIDSIKWNNEVKTGTTIMCSEKGVLEVWAHKVVREQKFMLYVQRDSMSYTSISTKLYHYFCDYYTPLEADYTECLFSEADDNPINASISTLSNDKAVCYLNDSILTPGMWGSIEVTLADGDVFKAYADTAEVYTVGIYVAGDAVVEDATKDRIVAITNLKKNFDVLQGTEVSFKTTAPVLVNGVAAEGVDSVYTVVINENTTIVVGELTSCADANVATANTVLAMDEFVVAYVNGSYTYIQDATGSALIYKSNYGLNAGDTVTGLVGKIDVYNNLVEIVPSMTVNKLNVKAGVAPEPALQEEVITLADVNKYVRIEGVTVNEADTFTTASQETITAVWKDTTLVIYNKFKVAQTFSADSIYDIVCAVSVFKEQLQVYFISATAKAKEEPEPEVAQYQLHGSWVENWGGPVLKIAEDKATATATVEMTEGNYNFGIKQIDATGNQIAWMWTANTEGDTFTREANAFVFIKQEKIDGKDNGKNPTLAADVDGVYTFVWTYADNTLTITFPAKSEGIFNTTVEGQAEKFVRDGQLIIRMNGVEYNVLGAKLQ